VIDPESTITMPTLQRYKNEPGFYIRAMTSDAGNITYQVSKTAGEKITDLGYQGGDDLPWKVVNTFRRTGEIYTEGSGTDGNEPSAELDSSVLTKLSLAQKRKLALNVLNDDALGDGKKVELISDVLTQQEWVDFVRELTGSGPEEPPVEVQNAVESWERNVDEDSVDTRDLLNNEQVQESILQIRNHPWEVVEFEMTDEYISYEFVNEDSLRIEILDFRHLGDEVTPLQEIPDSEEELDFEFCLHSDTEFPVYGTCVLYIRDNHLITSDFVQESVDTVSEEMMDGYLHGKFRDAVLAYGLCIEFFEDLEGYDITDPHQDYVTLPTDQKIDEGKYERGRRE
jgi:hypothetical protein